MILDKEEVTVINRTDKKMQVTLELTTQYRTYNLFANDYRVYDDFSYPVRREIKVILEEAEGGEE